MGTSKGFTLLELMVATAILGIMASVALPNLSSLIDRYSTSANVRAFMQTLKFARYHALKSGTDITLCPVNGSICTDNWNKPIRVFQDRNRNQRVNAGEEILMSSHIPIDQNSVITRSGTGNHLRFNWKGHAFGSATTFVICARENHQASRQVILNFQGRVRSRGYLSRNGTPYASLGSLACPQV
ncbi:prepilin-type N-terminal cleavage/methylation domain-containing protein [Bermanella marisrubri]|uniref:Type II secretion system protein H n=1 Tax=Bermanella marisrubri TaxID=207949 RepID=Q1MYR5_9GAMM|nr:GspH/FimT family pseudopilin [Bermanella marisrubri]EAT11141.1 putative type IV pilus biogenesis protein [Oceanobacter sp. RED65] [Bermanella marisrubri]QIZ85757.1 prepilin-type N-terminal cleavage/methylation domain-containing protein [Bermanella marisrubri]